MDCIFCKIIKGEVPCSKVYEDDDVLAFLDISPNNKGHTLVIPKQHHETILDIPDELLKKVIMLVKKVSIVLKKDSDGINILQNNYKPGGQLVPHIHFHIIPRFENDNHKFEWSHIKYEDGEVEQYRQKIENLLK